jgi:hypothetical protein
MINFPINPEVGDTYTDIDTGLSWSWTGEVWDYVCDTPSEPVSGSGISFVTVPSTSTSACSIGQFAEDTNFLYVCIATNQWLRVARDLSF